MRRTGIYVACLVLHLFIIIIISCRETIWLVAHGLTILPSPLKQYLVKAEAVASAARAGNFPVSSPTRRALVTYLHIAGIERGYGYFAPNVPESYKLVFELHHSDGRVDYEVAGADTPRRTCGSPDYWMKSDAPGLTPCASIW